MNDTMNTDNGRSHVSAQDAQVQLDRAQSLRLDARDGARRFGWAFIGSGLALGGLLALSAGMRGGFTWAVFGLLMVAMMWMDRWTKEAPSTPRGIKTRNRVAGTLTIVVLVIALSLYTGAFIAEIVRAGVMAVSRGQSEAAAALGLRARPIMALVVLPQALRVIVPPLISQFLNLTKNSSLAIAVGFPDLRATLGGTTLNQTGREMESMILMMGIYLVVSLVISGVMNIYNASVKLKER